MPVAFHNVAIWLIARDRILARDETARRSVLDFPCNRSRTGDVKSVGGPPMQQVGEWLAKLGSGRVCEVLLPKIALISRSSPT